MLDLPQDPVCWVLPLILYVRQKSQAYHNEETQIMCKGLKWWYDCKAEKEKKMWEEKKEKRNEEGNVNLAAGELI